MYQILFTEGPLSRLHLALIPISIPVALFAG